MILVGGNERIGPWPRCGMGAQEALMDSRQRVYIVDDDPSFGKSLERLLSSKGISAQCFLSGRAFLDSVPADQKGAVIVDLNMPEMDGIALMDAMREFHYSMSIIAVTGRTQAATLDQVIQHGAVGYLQKPFSPESLLEMIRK